MLAIRTRELTKDYFVGFWRPRPYRALDGLTLEIAAGDVFGFLGPNGAGKTTTLKLLMQLVFPTSGDAEILGHPVGDVATRRRIGYLPENPYFYDHLTAEELLDYYGRLFGMAASDRRRRVSATLDRLGIGAERRLQLRKFSKGMLQRVGLAQALLNEPDVLFLDEPMSGLDPLGRRDVRALMLELRDQGRTIFFSSHILSDAEALCSRVAIVAKGRLAEAGRLADLGEFAVQGWELVMAGVPASALDRVRARSRRVQTVAGDRYVIDLPPDGRPEELLRELTAAGAALVSLNPVRETLEDLFVRRVAEVGDGVRAADRAGTIPGGDRASEAKGEHANGAGQGAPASERVAEVGDGVRAADRAGTIPGDDRASEAKREHANGAGQGAPASERVAEVGDGVRAADRAGTIPGDDRASEAKREHANGAGQGAPASERVGGSGGAKPPGE